MPPKDILSPRTRLWFRRAVVCVGLLAVASIAAVLTMRLAIHGAEVKVPDLRGLTAADAMKRAADAGLSATIADRFYSPTTPLGTVLTQFPEPGASVRRDWIIRLVESLGPQSVSIPNVTGMAQRDAVLAIRHAHLDLGTVAVVPYPLAAGGTVIAQDPAASDHQVDRARLSLLLATGGAAATASDAGPGSVPAVPTVLGMPFHQAAQTVLSAGYRLGPTTDASSPDSKAGPGVVILQRPSAGQHAAKGSAVELTIAR
jgi:beta-lactam-binding protein with PASTA domain